MISLKKVNKCYVTRITNTVYLPSAICDIAPLEYPYHEYDMMKFQFLKEAIIYSSQLAMVCFPEIVLEFHIHDICDLTLKTFHLVDQSESISQNYQN